MKQHRPVTKRVIGPKDLHGVYKKLRKAHGDLKWWPAKTPFEVIIGAILTQNTAWKNVERAIENLRAANCLTVSGMSKTSEKSLARLIRPAGYFNVKAKRIKNFMCFLNDVYEGSLSKMKRQRMPRLRKQLLGINGIGEETADCILLYALDKPSFVIDAYTKRIFSRHGSLKYEKSYSEWKAFFEASLEPGTSLYNDYHAQIVETGKRYCKTRIVDCDHCPLSPYL